MCGNDAYPASGVNPLSEKQAAIPADSFISEANPLFFDLRSPRGLALHLARQATAITIGAFQILKK